MAETTKQVNMNRNPEGKGGFQERPQDRSDGRWSKDNSFTYWMNKFKNMSVKELGNYEQVHLEEDMSVAESLAYTRIVKAKKDLKEFQEVANRTEGMPVKTIISDNTERYDFDGLTPEQEAKINEFKRADRARLLTRQDS